jgi:capsular polysaccharide transport system permease protein
MIARASRPPWVVMFSVWRALFLREAVLRISRERAAWLWLLLEPIVHIAFLLLLFMTVRVRVVGGIDTAIWLIVGLLAFFTFRRPAQRAMGAVGANQVLFTYRQIKPIDAVLMRAVVEGFLMAVITAMVLAGAALYGLPIVPADPLAALFAFTGLWLMGLGFGLTVSVASELVPEIGRLIGVVLTPLYFASGVIFPLDRIPLPYREYLMLNPVAHGLESARLAFAPYYRVLPETSLGYLYAGALAAVLLGFALHRRFETALVTR